ncbi:MAG: response regulator [Candidatus Omnitrophica bacterium]|nr:response regulator [Candidatus Omnitrophota bacterium]
MKKKVLLVDDENDILLIIGRRMEGWGYDVIKASGGQEAIDMMTKNRPDVVVLDYIMPAMDGLATLKGIRAIDAKIPVIMFTAFPDDRSIKGSEKLGVSAYIPKLSILSSTESSLETALHMAVGMLKA